MGRLQAWPRRARRLRRLQLHQLPGGRGTGGKKGGEEAARLPCRRRLQPWIRDNAKIYYIFIFVSAPLGGALLAAPFEYVAGAGPGLARINFWLSVCGLAPAPAEEEGGSGGAAAADAAAAAAAPKLKSKASDEDEGEGSRGGVGSRPGAGAPRFGGPRRLVQRPGHDSAAAAGKAADAAPASSPKRRSGAGRGCGGRGCIGMLLALMGVVAAPPLLALSVGSGLALLYSEYREAQAWGRGDDRSLTLLYR